MKDRHAHLMHLDAKQLHNYLMEHYAKEPPLVRDSIYKTVRAQQLRRANNGRRTTQVHKWWADMMSEAQREKKSARASLDHNKEDLARQEVYGAYLKTVKTVLDKIKMYKGMKLTPKGVQAKLVKEEKEPYPNNLSHWSDMVPPRVREAITEAFEDLPYKPKAKRKVPFTRD